MALKACKECRASVSTFAKVCPNCGKKWPAGGFSTPAKIGIAVLGIFVFGQVAAQMLGKSSPSNRVISLSPKEEALQKTKVTMDWGKSGFGSVMLANITITNGSSVPIKDITIKCVHFAKSGTEIDSNTRTIYDIVNANSIKKFPKFNMGFIHSQVDKSSCEIVNLVIAR